MYQTINKILDEPYINFIIKNKSFAGLKDPIFNMLKPLLHEDSNILTSGFSNESKIINGRSSSIQRNKTFKYNQGFISLYCVMIFLNDSYNGGNLKLYDIGGETLITEIKPMKGSCVIFDNNMYYSYEPYTLTGKVDRMILRTFIMGKIKVLVETRIKSMTNSSLDILQNAINVGMDLVSSPTKPVFIQKELKLSTSPLFEFSPLSSPVESSIGNDIFSFSNPELPSIPEDKIKEEEDVDDDEFNRTRTFSNPELPHKHMLLGRLGNHRLTSVSMLEFPTISHTPSVSPTVSISTSRSDLDKNTLYRRLSKLYKKK